MDFRSHCEDAESLAEQLGKTYNVVGGAFLFYWVDDRFKRTLGFACSDHFIDPGLSDIKQFFHEAMRSYLGDSQFSNCNLWRLATGKSKKFQKVYALPPQQLASSQRWKETIKRQSTTIKNLLKPLEQNKVPFIFYYRFPDQVGASNGNNRIISYSHHGGAGRTLIESDGWNRTISLGNRREVRSPLVTPSKKQPRSTAHGQSVNRREKRARVQLDMDSVGDDHAMADNSNIGGDEDSVEYVPYAGEDPLEKLYYELTHCHPRAIPPTLVCATAARLQIVLPDLVKNGSDKASAVPVLVSLDGMDGNPKECACTCSDFFQTGSCCPHTAVVKQFEAQFRQLRQPSVIRDVVPVYSRQNQLVAYATLSHSRPAVVRVIRHLGRRVLSCTRSGHTHCDHVEAVLRYEKDSEMEVTVVEASGFASDDINNGNGDEKEPHRYIKSYQEHYNLPTDLAWPLPQKEALAIFEVKCAGGSHFLGRVVENQYALAPKLGGICECGLSYRRGGYAPAPKAPVCTVYLERPHEALKAPLYHLNCPNNRRSCRIKYDGTADGIFMLSETQAVALHYLYKGLDYLHSSAMPPGSFYASLLDDYSGQYCIGSAPAIPFFCENTWRNAFFLFLHCVGTEPSQQEDEETLLYEAAMQQQQQEEEEASLLQEQQHEEVALWYEAYQLEQQQEEEAAYEAAMQQQEGEASLLQQQEQQEEAAALQQDAASLLQQQQHEEAALQYEASQLQEQQQQQQQQEEEYLLQQQEAAQQQQRQDEASLLQQQQEAAVRQPFKFKCVVCCGTPRCLIVDGTGITMKKHHFSGKSITERLLTAAVVERPHNRNDRAFFNVGGERARLKKETTAFSEALKLAAAESNDNDDDNPTTSTSDDPLDVENYPTIMDKGGKYGLKDFLQWIHENVTNQRLSKDRIKDLATFVGRDLATDSPVLQYLPTIVAESVQAAVQPDGDGILQIAALKNLAKHAPSFFKVLEAAGAALDFPFTVPTKLKPLLAELCERVSFIGAGPGIERVEALAANDRKRPSVYSEDCLDSGICSGLPQLRERPRFAADDNDSEDKGCRKNFQAGGGRTGGVMTLFCEHGICYADFVLQESESRDHLFSFMVKYLEKPPEVLIYDFGCAVLDYCLNRLPGWFKNMRVLIDRMHWDNHKSCCCSFNMRLYQDVDSINSQIAEQCNAAMKKLNPTLHRSSQPFFMAVLRQYLHGWNEAKNKKLMQTLQRCGVYTA